MVKESKRVNILIPCGCGRCNLQIYKFDEHNGWKEKQYAKGHANKGKSHSEEWNRKIGLPKVGKARSEETKRKLSESLKGRFTGKDNVNYGKTLSEEHKKKLSDANKGRFVGRPISEAQKKFLSESRKGEGNPMWKGGRRRHIDGYIKIWKPDHPYADHDGYVFEHRLVMEKHLGRYLTKDEEVHHKNKKKYDNRIKNLQLMTKEEHSKLHRIEDWKNGKLFGENHKKMLKNKKSLNLYLNILDIMGFEK